MIRIPPPAWALGDLGGWEEVEAAYHERMRNMGRPRMLDETSRKRIAQAYLCGEPPTETAKEWGVSVPNVINWAKQYEREMTERRLKVKAQRELRAEQRRREIVPPPLEMPEPDSPVYRVQKLHHSASSRPGSERHMNVTLPRLSIQGGRK